MAHGSAAAAAAARRLMDEEEMMTHYSDQDLGGEWEFKIVRANTAAFRDPAVFDRLIQEESQSGWILLEKFDNTRVRFKRPVSARNNDRLLPQGVDPYRTQWGMSPMWFAIILTGVIVGASLVFTFFIMLLVAALTGAVIFQGSM